MGMDSGVVRGNLALWGTIALGIAMAFYSYLKPREEKDQGLNPLEEEDKGLDRLPDDVLGKIVSRLSLIEASRTSVLSKRWRKLRASNPVLRIDCLCTLGISHDHVADGDKQRFLSAVHQCLEVYSGSGQTLRTFLVSCCFLNEHSSHAVRWMQILSRLDVKYLVLSYSCKMLRDPVLDSAFPFSFKLLDGFSELFYLGLSSCNVETSFVRQCNSLKELHLNKVPLPGQKLSDLLLSCPNLVELKMTDCQLPRNLKFSGPRPMLKKLVLFCCDDVQKLEISGANLVTIEIYFVTDVEILLSTVPKLETLHLATRRMNYSLKDFPRDLLQLKNLLIETKFQVPLLPPTFQVFGNVRILYLLTRGCYPIQQASGEVDLWSFTSVLSACPNLVEFYLTVGKVSGSEEESMVKKWPTLQHNHLKHMELSGFSGTQYELEFAKFILRSTQVLKSLVLRSSWRIFTGDHFRLEEEDAQQFDAELVRGELEGQALSESATLELF